MLLVAGLAPAQDALRSSMAGDAAAEAQRKQMANQSYTFKVDDFKVLVTPSMEMDYNDNINLAKTGVQSDYILRPLLQLVGSYPISQQCLLSFSIGAGYDEYLQHSQYSDYRLDSGSLLSLDMRVKDFLFNFHDSFSFTQDPGTQPTLANTAQYATFMNTAGLTTTWDLEDVVLTLGYNHQNTFSSTKQFSYDNSSSEQLLSRAGLKFTPDLTAGVEGTASFMTYDQAVLNNNQNYSAGLYADWSPGPGFHVQPRAGYTIYQFEQTSQSGLPSVFYFNGYPTTVGQPIRTANVNSWYADLTLSHQISKAITYAFSAGHEVLPGIGSDLGEDYYIRPSVTWAIIKDLTLAASFSYEYGNQGMGNITGNLVETYDWYESGLTLRYPIMKKLIAGLNYRLTLRSSDISAMAYTQNLVGLTLTYQLQ